MSITTKSGDKGKTSLYRGKRVAKDHLRIEICGNLDELNSYLGLSKSLAKSKKIKKILSSVQKDLFIIGSEIATEIKFINKLKQRIDNKFVKGLEKIIDQLEKKSSLATFCFQLPGRDVSSSSLDIARTIARRLERRVVSLSKKGELKNKFILVYLNRLSDLLFLMAHKPKKKSSKKR